MTCSMFHVAHLLYIVLSTRTHSTRMSGVEQTMNSEIRYKRSLAANMLYIWLIVSQWFMNLELWPLRIKLGGVGQSDTIEHLEQEMSYFEGMARGEGGFTKLLWNCSVDHNVQVNKQFRMSNRKLIWTSLACFLQTKVDTIKSTNYNYILIIQLWIMIK